MLEMTANDARGILCGCSMCGKAHRSLKIAGSRIIGHKVKTKLNG